MNASSNKAENPFESLQARQIYALLDVLRGLQMRNVVYVERRFTEKARYFEETLKFLVAIKAIRVFSDELNLIGEWKHSTLAQDKTLLLEYLLRHDTEYRKEISQFLSNFKVLSEQIVYQSNPRRKSYEQYVRNFLMELDVLTYQPLEDIYILNAQHINFYITSQSCSSFMSPVKLENVLAEKERVGLSAEEEIVCYAKNRLGSALSNEVVHVSKDNTAAGYDIRSVSFSNDGEKIPRLIEVKAVSFPSFTFYWSANEVEIARKLKSFYYLYLLPVKGSNTLDIENLKIISNPCEIIINSNEKWITEPDGVKCFLKNLN